MSCHVMSIRFYNYEQQIGNYNNQFDNYSNQIDDYSYRLITTFISELVYLSI